MQWLDKKEEDGQIERILEVGGAQVMQPLFANTAFDCPD
jgi:hypothetical protein